MAERGLVIIPTYNERDNIARLIDQVLGRDDRLDVLVVDDGSPDGTGAIVDEICDRIDDASASSARCTRGDRLDVSERAPGIPRGEGSDEP